jgi:hypothetical protein
MIHLPSDEIRAPTSDRSSSIVLTPNCSGVLQLSRRPG